MGMDLQPINPSENAPKDENGNVIWGRYNWFGWRWLWSHLEAWGVDTSQLAGSNDGDIIDAETCIKIGDALEAHRDELVQEYIEEGKVPVPEGYFGAGQIIPRTEEDIKQYREWIDSTILRWRSCGGYYQY